jgi:hypothetical protein
MYHQCNIQQLYVLPTQCIYVFCVDLRKTAIISLYNINWLVCITKTECVYCAVRTVFMCFVWISEQTAIISLYSFNWLVCITETEFVYCAVRSVFSHIKLRTNRPVLTEIGVNITIPLDYRYSNVVSFNALQVIIIIITIITWRARGIEGWIYISDISF